jgi:hypothetical protein
LGTGVVLVTDSGAVPAGRVDVICPCRERVPVVFKLGRLEESPANPISLNLYGFVTEPMFGE